MAELQNISIEQSRSLWAALVPDDSVSAFSDHILDVILVRDIERDLPRTSSRWSLLLLAGHTSWCDKFAGEQCNVSFGPGDPVASNERVEG